jgi:hypothetical protein
MVQSVKFIEERLLYSVVFHLYYRTKRKTCSANALVFSSSKFEFVTKVNPSKVRIGTKRSSIYTSPQNENLNLLVRIKFLNLFLYSSLKINWSEQSFPGLTKDLLFVVNMYFISNFKETHLKKNYIP